MQANPSIRTTTISRTALKINWSSLGLLQGLISTCLSGIPLDVNYVLDEQI